MKCGAERKNGNSAAPPLAPWSPRRLLIAPLCPASRRRSALHHRGSPPPLPAAPRSCAPGVSGSGGFGVPQAWAIGVDGSSWGRPREARTNLGGPRLRMGSAPLAVCLVFWGGSPFFSGCVGVPLAFVLCFGIWALGCECLFFFRAMHSVSRQANNTDNGGGSGDVVLSRNATRCVQ